MKWNLLLWVALGGGLGSMCRAVLSQLMQGMMPWTTMTVNIVGCLLIGAIMGAGVQMAPGGSAGGLPEWLRAFAVIGFCGGFTTFSAFSYENFLLIGQGRFVAAALNMVLSVVLCVVAVAIGFRLAKAGLGS